MKSTATFIAVGVLGAIAVAQPHNHAHQLRHLHKNGPREVVVEWETVYETVTVEIDENTTRTIFPSPTATRTGEASPGNFFQGTTTTTTSVPQTTPPPAPATTTSTTTPVQVAAVETTTSTPAATTTSSSGSSGSSSDSTAVSVSGNSASIDISSGQRFKSWMTYYTPGLGSCGSTNTDSDYIVAVDIAWFFGGDRVGKTNIGVDQPSNPLCGRKITISANGKTADVTVKDSCEACRNNMGVDVTKTVFNYFFGSLDAGKVDVTWTLN